MKLGLKKKKDQFKKIENKTEVIEENPMQEMVDEANKEEREEVEEVSDDKEVIAVVKELPLQPVRMAKAEDGTIINYITTEEYLTKLANEED